MTNQELDGFWQNAKAVLTVKVGEDNFTFLNNLVPNHILGLMKEILMYASTQEQFPFLPGLRKHYASKGFKSWQVAKLLKLGLMQNTGKKGFGPSLYKLNASAFQNIVSVPEELPQSEHSGVQQRSSGSLVRKQREIWNYICKEVVGDRLMVTPEQVSQISEQVGCARGYVFQSFRIFSNLGFIQVASQGHGKGFLLTFNGKASKGAPAEGPKTVSLNILEALELEIKTLESQKSRFNEEILKRQRLCQEIDQSLAKKIVVREEIKRLSGMTGS